jgi:hypothetical protein
VPLGKQADGAAVQGDVVRQLAEDGGRTVAHQPEAMGGSRPRTRPAPAHRARRSGAAAITASAMRLGGWD